MADECAIYRTLGKEVWAMIMKCTEPGCDHEWQITMTYPCYSCGAENFLMHSLSCPVAYCDWCNGAGWPIGEDYMDVEVDLDDIKDRIGDLQR